MYCGGGIPPASQTSVAVCFSTAHGDAQTIRGGVILSRRDLRGVRRSGEGRRTHGRWPLEWDNLSILLFREHRLDTRRDRCRPEWLVESSVHRCFARSSRRPAGPSLVLWTTRLRQTDWPRRDIWSARHCSTRRIESVRRRRWSELERRWAAWRETVFALVKVTFDIHLERTWQRSSVLVRAQTFPNTLITAC